MYQDSQHEGRSLSSLQKNRLAALSRFHEGLPQKKGNENKEVEADKTLRLSVDGAITFL